MFIKYPKYAANKDATVHGAIGKKPIGHKTAKYLV